MSSVFNLVFANSYLGYVLFLFTLIFLGFLVHFSVQHLLFTQICNKSYQPSPRLHHKNYRIAKTKQAI